MAPFLDPTYRGAFENVAMVEMRSQLAIERAGLVTLHLQPARRSSIPTMMPPPGGFECYGLSTSLTTGILSPKVLLPDCGEHYVEHKNLRGFHNATNIADNDSSSLAHRSSRRRQEAIE